MSSRACWKAPATLLRVLGGHSDLGQGLTFTPPLSVTCLAGRAAQPDSRARWRIQSTRELVLSGAEATPSSAAPHPAGSLAKPL